VATRQTSSSGRPKSPRIQVVLPEELCERLAALADGEARTVSNMARVLIQQGVERLGSRSGSSRCSWRVAACRAWPLSIGASALSSRAGSPPVGCGVPPGA